MGKDQTTTPGSSCPTLYDECVGSLTSPADHNSGDAGDGAYGLSSLSEKTRISNHLQMSLQRQHIRLSYFKTMNVGLVWGSNPRPSSRQSDALPTELTGPLRCFRQKNISFPSRLIQVFKIQSNLRLRPLLVSDHLSSATSFPKYQKFASQITIFGTSCKRPPLVSDRDHFYS